MELGRDGEPKNHININLKLFGSFGFATKVASAHKV